MHRMDRMFIRLIRLSGQLLFQASEWGGLNLSNGWKKRGRGFPMVGKSKRKGIARPTPQPKLKKTTDYTEHTDGNQKGRAYHMPHPCELCDPW